MNFRSNDVNELSEVKKIPGRRGQDFKRSMATYTLTIAIILACLIALTKMMADAKTNVDIAVLKQDSLGQQIITEENVGKGFIYKRNFTKDMIKYEDAKKELIGKSANYYLRSDVPLYKDQFTDQKSLRQRYMYDMTANEECLTIKYNTLEAGGTVLMPGDRVRIRISYKVGDSYGDSGSRQMAVLFSDAVVKDMLNSDGVSIYEKYREIWSKSEKEKQEILRDDKFLNSVEPVSLMITADSAQVDEYSKYKYAEDASYIITLLKRDRESNIFDLPLDILSAARQASSQNQEK